MAIQATAFLDDEWVEVITEELILMPDRVAFSVEPETLAIFDFQMGYPCDPVARGYRGLQDIETYICAYKDAQAAMTETLEYMSWQEDVEWIRGGC